MYLGVSSDRFYTDSLQRTCPSVAVVCLVSVGIGLQWMMSLKMVCLLVESVRGLFATFT